MRSLDGRRAGILLAVLLCGLMCAVALQGWLAPRNVAAWLQLLAFCT